MPIKPASCRAGKIRGSDNTDSGVVIETQALELNADKFNNRAVFVDHAGFFEYPSLSRLAGVTVNPTYNPQDQSIEGEIKLNNTEAGTLAADIIEELLADPAAAPDVGLSMVAYVRFAAKEQNDPRRIVDIRHVESVDLVFQPASDARILQKLSAVGAQGLRPDNFVQTQGANPMPEPVINTPEPNVNPIAGSNAVSAWQDALAETASASILAASGLPEASRQRLSQGKYNQPSELKAAIETEKAYLAALNADSVINIGGQAPRSPHLSGMMTSLDKIQLALDALFLGGRPPAGIQPLTGIRELYHLLSGDYEMTGVFQGDRIQLANVNSSTMANMVANALNKVVAQEFIAYPQWWLPIVIGTDFDSLQAVKWITLGGVGELPTVAEGAAYTELTWDDKYETAAFVKKGGYLGITMEAIDKDDTGRLRNAPRALAQAAWLTLSKSISAIFTANTGTGPTLTDSTALFDGSTANLGTTALSITTYIAARTAMRKFTEVNSGERLGALTAPKYLLVPPDLEITALQILSSAGRLHLRPEQRPCRTAKRPHRRQRDDGPLEFRPRSRHRRRPVDRYQQLGSGRRSQALPHHRTRLPLWTRPRDLLRRLSHRRTDVHQRHHAGQGPLRLCLRSHRLARSV